MITLISFPLKREYPLAEIKDENEFIHTENFVLVDKKGRIRGVYNGTLSLDMSRLKRHLKLLKKES